MTDPAKARQAAVPAARAELERHVPEFVGLRTAEAEALAARLGVLLRLIDLDGDGWYTQELRHDRITAETRSGVVVSASVV